MELHFPAGLGAVLQHLGEKKKRNIARSEEGVGDSEDNEAKEKKCQL